MRNYFKTKSGFIRHFEDSVPESIEDAFIDTVVANGESTLGISVFSATSVPGAWDVVPVIGFRTRREVLADMAATGDEDELDKLDEELQLVDSLFLSRGRPVPLQAVAA